MTMRLEVNDIESYELIEFAIDIDQLSLNPLSSGTYQKSKGSRELSQIPLLLSVQILEIVYLQSIDKGFVKS